MEIITVEQRLQSEGLDYPQLNALQADDTLYTLLAHQPPGRIRITSTSIGNADPVEAHQRSSALFDLVASLDNQPDLLVSPEYSIPWETLQDAIERGIKPGRGKLWVLGCESIPLNGLNSVRERLDQLAVVLDDDSFPGALTTQQYRDPLVYAFLSNASVDKAERLVLLVQYKTAPSGDPENTEATGMLPGVYVYAFGSQPSEVRLITLICSDVFEFTQELIDQYYSGLLLLHIQLNNSPRHILYKKYRPELFCAAGDTELLCLNWAADVVSVNEDCMTEHPWDNICGSAWYLRSSDVNLSDDFIFHNHRHGIYYTRHEPIRAHALQFHYRPRIFLLQSTKVFHHAIPKPRSTRTGPMALKTFVWESKTARWIEPEFDADLPNDGFCEQIDKIGADGTSLDDVRELYRAGPIAVERVMAITAGKFGVPKDWFSPAKIDSMQLCEQEIVRRVTITQDTDPVAIKFRTDRYALTKAVADLRAGNYAWPSSVEVLRKGFKFNWSPQVPNRNVVASDGTLATVVHAGMFCDSRALDLLDQQVRKTLAGPPPEPERLLSKEQAKQFIDQHNATSPERFCILYATTRGTDHYLSGRGISITTPRGQSDVDIGAPSFYRIAGNPPSGQ